MLSAALKYHELGYSVIPFREMEKRPAIDWREYQQRRPETHEIRSWWTKWPKANVGIVTGKISGICVIDIDTPEGKEIIDSILPESITPVAADTPRGGQHLWFSMPDFDFRNYQGKNGIPGVDVRAEGGVIVCPPSVRAEGMYKFTCKPNGNPLPSVPASFFDLLKEYNNTYYNTNINTIYNKNSENFVEREGGAKNAEKFFSKGRRDDDLFSVALALADRKLPHDFIQKTVINLGLSCNPPFPKEEAKIKATSAIMRANAKESTLADDVREWILSTHGHFLSTEIAKDLNLSTRLHKKNLSEILRRLVKDGFIERFGNKNGHFRRIEDDLVKMDLSKPTQEFFDLQFPLGIHSYVSIYPGNIVVVAGSPNAGKSAFLFNLIALNMHKYEMDYFNSEAGEDELRDRLLNFDMPLESWKFNAYERSGNFADVIRPDRISVIDFLEVHDNFYEVGGMIRKIHDKIGKGVAIIALQKKRGATLGRGAEFALEKPRLYLSMDNNRIEIVKAKKWANPEINPNGMVREFKLAQGCHFHPVDRWLRPEELKF